MNLVERMVKRKDACRKNGLKGLKTNQMTPKREPRVTILVEPE